MKKLHKDLYAAKSNPAFLDLAPLPYLMIDGRGEPAGDAYTDAVAALYGVAYAVRALLKPTTAYSVAPLEGLWYTLPGEPRSSWTWTMMLLQPAEATSAVVAEALAVTRKKKPDLPVDSVRLDLLDEGRSVQILHVGPYATEPETVGRLMAFAHTHGVAPAGAHHEIYLSDPRRVAPEAMKTIIRYPVAPPPA
ncbi:MULTISPECIES: GyrI-like domain-containing protein [Nonomuraea]|uniref:GyrI-like domain-containing protein n=1 Tax=Nonomuraea mangrovi TaxID=2316207 RepID=A0ABW4SUM0_9ACTN